MQFTMPAFEPVEPQIVAWKELLPDEQSLVMAAVRASDDAYCPYSNFSVGAAICARNKNSGQTKIFTGANVESAAYPLGRCAEGNAIGKAVNDHHRIFLAAAVYCKKAPGRNGTPCGECRGNLLEFKIEDYPVLVVYETDANGFPLMVARYTIEQLMPDGFCPASLGMLVGS